MAATYCRRRTHTELKASVDFDATLATEIENIPHVSFCHLFLGSSKYQAQIINIDLICI